MEEQEVSSGKEVRDAEPGSGEKHRGAEFFVHFGLVTLSLAVALVMGEFGTRLLAPQQLILKRPDIWQPIDTLGWIHRPLVRTSVNTGERTVSLFTDREGFRVSAAGRIESETKILVLGDSYMEALQVEYGRSVPGLLERNLPRLVGRPVSVRNTGVGGWNPPQYLLQGKEVMRRERFDLVLVSLYIANDIVERRVDRFPPRTPEEVHALRFPRSWSAKEWVDALLYPVNDFLEVRSHLFVLVKRQADRVLMRLGLTASYFPEVFRKEEKLSGRWEVTAEICHEIAELAREQGAHALFVLIPEVSQVHTEEFDRHVLGFGIDPTTVDLEQPNERMVRSLSERGLHVIDALPALREAAERGHRLYGKVDRHFSPAGHKVVARLLAPVVAELLRQGTDFSNVAGPSVGTDDPPGGGDAVPPSRSVQQLDMSQFPGIPDR